MRKRKSKLQKRKDNPNSAYWKHRADKAWSQITCLQSRCAVCGSVGAQAHHLISRAVRSLRHKLINGIPLCALHHLYDPILSAHGGPLGFANWLEEHRPEQWQWVRENCNRTGKYNFQEATMRLEAILAYIKKSGKFIPYDDKNIDEKFKIAT